METEISFRLYGEFTNLNTYINAERTNRFHGAKIKREETWRVHCELLRLFGEGSQVMEKAYPVHITCTWYTKNLRVDPDNTAFSLKFLLDGMVSYGLLRNDSRKEIASITHLFKINKDKPYVEIVLRTENTL